MSSHRARAYFLLLLATLSWGAAPVIIKLTLNEISPTVFLLYRFGISSIITLFLILTKKIHLPKSNRTVALSLLYGFLSTTLALSLLFEGLDRSAVLDLVLIGALGPLMITLGGAFFFHDRITKREKSGITLALTGTLVALIIPALSMTQGSSATGAILLSIFLLVDSSSVLLVKKLEKDRYDALFLANFSFLIGFITLIPYALTKQSTLEITQEIVNLTLKGHLGVIYMAIISGSFAYFVYIKGLKTIEVSEASLFSYLQPVISTPMAIIFLSEQPSLRFFVGAILILSGVLLAEYKSKKRS